MTFLEAIAGALSTYARARRDAAIKKSLTAGEITPETIARIAEDYGYSWRIVRLNGDVIEFTKPADMSERENPSW